MHLFVAVVVVPCYISEVVASAVLIVATAVAAPCSILPLRLCGQTEVLTGHGVELEEEVLAVIPTDIFHRKVVTFPF